MALNRKSLADLRAVLTPAQRQRLTALQARGGPGGLGRGPLDPKALVDRMAAELRLSADQKKRALPIVTRRVQAMQRLRQQAGSSANREALRGQMRAQREGLLQDLRGVLTAAQLQQARQMGLGFGRPGGGPRPPR